MHFISCAPASCRAPTVRSLNLATRRGRPPNGSIQIMAQGESAASVPVQQFVEKCAPFHRLLPDWSVCDNYEYCRTGLRASAEDSHHQKRCSRQFTWSPGSEEHLVHHPSTCLRARRSAACVRRESARGCHISLTAHTHPTWERRKTKHRLSNKRYVSKK